MVVGIIWRTLIVMFSFTQVSITDVRCWPSLCLSTT